MTDQETPIINRNSDLPPLVLYSWGGRWNLPTVDPFCLAAQAYLSFIEASWSVYDVNNPLLSPNGALPILKIGEHELAVGVEQIIRRMQSMGLDLDRELTPEQRATCTAFRAMADQVLYDAQLYEWFVVEENYGGVVRPFMSHMLPFHARYFVPHSLKVAAHERLAVAKYGLVPGRQTSISRTETAKEKPVCVPEVMKRVRDCYAALAAKLGDQTFFFGDLFTSLDAVVYGHLAVHLYADEFKQAQLRRLLTKDFPTLVKYCDRIRHSMECPSALPTRLTTYPPLPATFWGVLSLPGRLLSGGTEEWRRVTAQWSWWPWRSSDAAGQKKKQQVAVKEQTPEEKEFARKRFWSVAGGVGLLLGYILWHGIISIEINSNDEEEEYEEMEYREEDVEDQVDDSSSEDNPSDDSPAYMNNPLLREMIDAPLSAE